MKNNAHTYNWYSWGRLYGNLTHPSYLDVVSKTAFSEVGRGAILLWLEEDKPSSVYVSRKWIASTISNNTVRKKLLKCVDRYKPEIQAVVLISLDDVSLSKNFDFRWFMIDFRRFKDFLGQCPPMSLVQQPSLI